jgi:hypothetical protein
MLVPDEMLDAPPLPADPALESLGPAQPCSAQAVTNVDEATLAARTVDRTIPISPMAHTASF